MINQNGEYNNAALFFSYQNPTISKFAIFQGTDVRVFLDKKEFTGSILKQLDDVLYFANLSNRKKITITGKAERDEYLDIPQRALREAIVNCYCHRDWTLSGDIKIEFYDDRVQIFSPGSLPDGLTLENIKMGMVAKRNKIIVNTFDKIDVIENYASGVRRIFEDYENFEKQPKYYISDNGVIVTLYNRNYDGQNDVQNNNYEKNYDGQKNTHLTQNFENSDKNGDRNVGQKDDKKSVNDGQKTTKKPKHIENSDKNSDRNVGKNEYKKLTIEKRREKIVELMRENNKITTDIIKDILQVSKRTIERDINKLSTEKIIKYYGSAKDGYWIVKK